MHVTSDYYRGREHQPKETLGLVARWRRSVQNAKRGQDAEPLCPSKSTLRRLASHCENSHALTRSA
ncbi:MAG: hypothetical protein ACI8Z5_000850 [Lentimonas sp.]|jgi:hypothetical protein